MTTPSLGHLCDRELLLETKRLASNERQAIAQLIAAIAELDTRRLYLGEGCSSLFAYCTQVLHLSEHAAYGRIEAARAARRFPVILELLVEGSVSLTTVGLLASHLTPENHRAVLEEARHQSKRAVEQIVARLRPQPDVPSAVRKLPTPVATRSVPGEPPSEPPSRDCADSIPAVATPTPPRSAVVTALAPERFKVQFTVRRETYEKLRRAQDLLRHRIPNGDPAEVFDHALRVLLESLEKGKLAATDKPRPSRPLSKNSRHIPAAVKRAVWARDDARCAFVGGEGRCTERGFLEFHHVVPYAAGGEATLENTELRCRSHNAHESERFFGPEFAREAPAVYTSRTIDLRSSCSCTSPMVERLRSTTWTTG